MEPASAHLVIVSDDGGCHPAVDDAALAAAANGCVTSVSVLANRAGAERFVARAKEMGLGVGLHFDLTDGEPLTAEGRVLAREGAAFSGDKHALWNAAAQGRLSPEGVAAEARAQWNRLRELGGQPDHVDGHNHIHRYPDVLEGLLAGLPPGGRRFMRVPVDPNCPAAFRPGLPGTPLGAVEMTRRARFAGWRVADRFFGFRFTAEPGSDTLDELNPARAGTTEWMVHPGRGGTTPFRRDPRRELELGVLTDPATTRRLIAWGYTLALFGAVP